MVTVNVSSGFADAAPADDRSALIAFGSETGNAQDVAEEVGRLCERLRFTTRVTDLDSVSFKQLLQADLVIVVVSTTGQGDLPFNAQRFFKALRSARLPPNCLQKLRFTSFGLGDSSYPQFNWAHKKLSNRLLQLGAQLVCDRAESDEQHPEGIDGSFIPWITQLRQRLLEEYPLPSGIEALANDVLLEPKWKLCEAHNASRGRLPYTSSEDGAERYPDEPPDGLISCPNAIIARVIANDRITSLSHWQDVRHLSFALSGHHPYVPGDILSIYPKNFPIDVDHFLRTGNWSHMAEDLLVFEPTNIDLYNRDPSSYPPAPVPQLQDSLFTVRELLTNHLDIMSIPRRSFFQHIMHYTIDEFHVERLKEFTDPEFIDELFDYTTRPRRSILEVLDEFASVHIPWQKLCSVIPVMRARQFSIASGGLLKEFSDGVATATKVELAVAIVKYRTVIKRIREGVCTRYMACLRPGQEIAVTLQKGSLNPKPEQIAHPVVMIGPGTGVAPMRSLVHERAQWRADSEARLPAEDILFFGCRNAQSDFLFRDEWERFGEQKQLKTFVAFSRDQSQKIYVQDLVRQQSKLVFKALAEKRGMVYVCGSSGRMPQAVREAIIEVFQSEGCMERTDAEAYFARMEREGRYRQETW